MYCHRSGRGHIHVKLCADYQRGKDCCINAMPGRRHSSRKYKPNPEMPKDEFTHEAFWESIGFQDPCSSEDKEIFVKCAHFCPHPSHTREGEQPSFCTLPLWHDALSGEAAKRHIAQNGGLVSPDGHHFACSHSDAQPVHAIFLVDKSGSMSYGDTTPQTAPWRYSHRNRLGCALEAVQSFVERRRSSSPGDVLSFVAFDNKARPGPANVSIGDFDAHRGWLQQLKPDGGTSFKNAIEALSPYVRGTPSAEMRIIVIMLSDGWDDFPAAALQGLFGVMRGHALGKPLRMHTVQFPSGVLQGQRILQQIAETARGQDLGDDFAGHSSFMASVDGIALQEAFVGIADSLCKAAGGLIQT